MGKLFAGKTKRESGNKPYVVAENVQRNVEAEENAMDSSFNKHG